MNSQIKARPTKYQGIQMRSRLEAGFAAWLDRHHFTWEYEPYTIATEDGQYLPDFVLHNAFAAWLPEPTKIIVEVKPNSYSVEGRRDYFPETYDVEYAACDRGCPPAVTRLRTRPGVQRIDHANDCAIEVETRRIFDDYGRIRQQALLTWRAEPDTSMIVARPRGLDLMLRDPSQPQKRIEALEQARAQAVTDEKIARLLADMDQDGYDPAAIHWDDWDAHRIAPISLPSGRIGFALISPDGPWQGEYWKPGK